MRPQAFRALDRAAQAFRFADDTKSAVFDKPSFGLAITFTGNETLWAPFCGDTGLLVAVAGRPAFDEQEWDAAPAVEGTGGLAARVIAEAYQRDRENALERLNGNCAVVVYDAGQKLLHLVTDRCGVFPVFEAETEKGRVYGSHPDALARWANQRHRLDETSLAEFILSGTVSPPFSYYENVRAVDQATVFTFDAATGTLVLTAKRRYFDLTFRGDPRVTEDELAQQLSTALRRAVQRRTLSRLGPTAVALSGGLDSRLVLASSDDRPRTFAFCCYDAPNRELKTAETIARSLSVPFLPLRRGADYYGEHAERGVRLSGGMGSFANNHLLGVIPRLKAEGMANLLTGCYCDYLFKGLPLNRRVHWLTRRERLAPFRQEFYFDHFSASTPLALRAQERRDSRIPSEVWSQDTASEVFEVEVRRTFPLCYEGDNQQRLVPQRVSGWSPPFVDRDVLDVYRRVPYQFKLNRSLFRKVVVSMVPQLRHVPDANTGAPPGASVGLEWVRSSQLRLERLWRRLHPSTAVDGSWPDWDQYLARSRALDSIWNRRNPEALDLFRRVLGPSALDDVAVLKRERPFLFVGLLTVKLWLEQPAW